MLDIKCPLCGEKIAEYSGPVGAQVPIESQFYVRNNGSTPEHGSSTKWACPHCKQTINELEAVLNAVSERLHPASKRAETERYFEGQRK